MGIDFSGPNPGTQLLGQYKTKTSIDFTQAAWNTVADHRVFTRTGMVRMLVFYYCTANLAGGGGATIKFGFTGLTSAYAAAQGFGNLTTGVYVVPQATATTLADLWANFLNSGALKNADVTLSGTTHVGFNIAVAALTGGTIDAYCFWTPISDDGLVVAASGGAL
jgi:hypothetical protein